MYKSRYRPKTKYFLNTESRNDYNDVGIRQQSAQNKWKTCKKTKKNSQIFKENTNECK